MESLTDYTWPKTIDSSSADIVIDFIVPALERSVRYDRGVGYFSSSWLREAAQGLVALADNEGQARIVASPILSEDDWDALQVGANARDNEFVLQMLERDLTQLERDLDQDTRSALAWMVADGLLEFRLAVPRSKLEHGEFHDKFGVFYDSGGNRVSFNGSYNDSLQGSLNYESMSVFTSWNDSLVGYVGSAERRFENLWQNNDPNVRVYDLPGAAKSRIQKLRTSYRPYSKPQSKSRRVEEVASWVDYTVDSTRIEIPKNLELRDYQEEAISAWFAADCRGLLEMATGTGKTITAMVAAVRLLDRIDCQVLVVTCPYTHLVDQWASELAGFGFVPIRAVGSRQDWLGDVQRELRRFSRGRTDQLTIVATNHALTGPLAEELKEFWPDTMLVIDEAHHAGAEQMRAALPEVVPWRLGLSATPVRHFDEEGSIELLDYFGGVIYEYGLDKAIGTALTS